MSPKAVLRQRHCNEGWDHKLHQFYSVTERLVFLLAVGIPCLKSKACIQSHRPKCMWASLTVMDDENVPYSSSTYRIERQYCSNKSCAEDSTSGALDANDGILSWREAAVSSHSIRSCRIISTFLTNHYRTLSDPTTTSGGAHPQRSPDLSTTLTMWPWKSFKSFTSPTIVSYYQ